MLAVGIGGFVGANLRYWFSLAIAQSAFPWATFAVNMIGCFGLAFFLTSIDTRLAVSEPLKLLVSTGFFWSINDF